MSAIRLVGARAAATELAALRKARELDVENYHDGTGRPVVEKFVGDDTAWVLVWVPVNPEDITHQDWEDATT